MDGGEAYNGYIEAHVLSRLAHLHHDQRRATGDAPGALDGFVGAFHRLDSHAGAFAHDYRLPQVEPGNLPSNHAAVGDVGGLPRVRSTARQHARLGHQRLQERRRVHQFDSLSFQRRGYRANQRIRIFLRQREEQLSELPVGPDRAEDLVVLHLTGHHGLVDALLMEQLERFAQVAHTDPMQPRGHALEFRRSLFAQRNHCHLDSLAPGRLEHQERKPAVARD